LHFVVVRTTFPCLC